MARLAGQFAGIVLVTVPNSEVNAFADELQALEGDDLHLTIQRTGPEAAWSGQALRLELVGHDRPGIVRDITRVLAERRVNIVELTTMVTSGSFSAEQMFHAAARLQLPDGLAAAELKAVLEKSRERSDDRHRSGRSWRSGGLRPQRGSEVILLDGSGDRCPAAARILRA